MTRAQDHRVTIERRGRSHRAVCQCGWGSHAWNELRPAEADAWHHVFGDDPVVDMAAVPEDKPVAAKSPAAGRRRAGREAPPAAAIDPSQEEAPVVEVELVRSRVVDRLVRHAQDLAASPSPYSRGATTELWRGAGEDSEVVRAALAEIEHLLARHERQSNRAADHEWLQLITAKRLLHQALSCSDEPEGHQVVV